MRHAFLRIISIGITGIVSGCANIKAIYSPVLGPMRIEMEAALKDSNPLIIIPGIGGSKLIDLKNKEVAWGDVGFNAYWPSSAKSNKLLALPLQPGVDPTEQEINRIGAKSVMDIFKIDFLPFNYGSINFDVYRTLFKSLVTAGYVPETINTESPQRLSPSKQTVYQFPYDWRKSNAYNAQKLNEYIQALSAQGSLQTQQKKPLKFDLVCHSMGCLVARYYLRYGGQGLGTRQISPNLDWRGGKKVENIIMLAPPNKGSLDTLVDLIEGWHPTRFKILNYPAAVIGTMPSMYELMPRPDIVVAKNQYGETIDLMNPQLWQTMQWGLLDPEQETILKQIASGYQSGSQRYRHAMSLQSKLLSDAQLFHSRLDVKSAPPKDLNFWLYAGVGALTDSQITVNTTTRKWTKKNTEAGDGSVTRPSAYAMTNRNSANEGTIIDWSNATFLYSDHMGLVKSNDFLVNFYYTLFWRKYLSTKSDNREVHTEKKDFRGQ